MNAETWVPNAKPVTCTWKFSSVVGGYYLQGIGESIGVVIVRVDIVLACCCTNKRKYLSKWIAAILENTNNQLSRISTVNQVLANSLHVNMIESVQIVINWPPEHKVLVNRIFVDII